MEGDGVETQGQGGIDEAWCLSFLSASPGRPCMQARGRQLHVSREWQCACLFSVLLFTAILQAILSKHNQLFTCLNTVATRPSISVWICTSSIKATYVFWRKGGVTLWHRNDLMAGPPRKPQHSNPALRPQHATETLVS